MATPAKNAKKSNQPEHTNTDGSEDKRFHNNGQGAVKHPDIDMRLGENRHDPKKVAERQHEIAEA